MSFSFATVTRLRSLGAQRCDLVKSTPKRSGLQGRQHRVAMMSSEGITHSEDRVSPSSPSEHGLAHSLVDAVLDNCWARCPGARLAADALAECYSGAPLQLDHLAFRTFGVEPLGIASASRWFLDLGYSQRDQLLFPNKKLKALWFAPPAPDLPRIFISEILVDQLTPRAQEIVQRHAKQAAAARILDPALALTGRLPWSPPVFKDYQYLATESEYAAWVLANGYALNHAAISVHCLRPAAGGASTADDHASSRAAPPSIEEVVACLRGRRFALNEEGGVVKISPDGLLLQGSTVADLVSVVFSGLDGPETRIKVDVPGAYFEFAERLVLPKHQGLAAEEVTETHRREGFEATSADKIFESTTLAAGSRG